MAYAAALGVLAGIAIPIVGCTRVSDASRFSGDDTPLSILSTVPRAGQADVDPRQRIDLCLSVLVDPRSAEEDSATVGSGVSVVDAEVDVQLAAWTAPGGGDAPPGSDAPWCLGSVVSIAPKVALSGGALYRVRLAPDLVGWNGQAIDTGGPGWVISAADEEPRWSLEFTIAPTDPGVPGTPTDDPTPTGPTLRELFAPGGPLQPERALCSCHRDPDDLAHARLDLTDVDTAFAGLVDRSGAQDTGFPMVTPRDPSQSFLVHKLLRTRDGDAILGVLGDAMPPDDPIPYADYVAIARWIEAGALR